MMCGGGVFLMLSAASGWPVAMLMMAMLIMALSFPLWRIRSRREQRLSRMFRR
ncbi:putative cytoplasmic transmembrane protein [Klebsiella pneumoniae]|uniref:Putative cytoplasmic transmembrane protein n=1 Tax=Klebsiella pneumoniae TaxID=573 RepID=A0A378AT23_KLEPN|nr:putative cytoplasmic transmembrane protein [Klebsiella pneumoniae]